MKFFLGLVASLFLLCISTEGVVTFTKNLKKHHKGTKPNIVFILTDDQDVTLGGMTPMMKVKRLLQEEGTTFSNMFVTTPLCCPSRSSILTGRYSHNHHAVNNSISGNCSSAYWQKTFEPKTMAVQIQNAGYYTFFAGKYLNQYGKEKTGGPAHVPPGWNFWYALSGNSQYYNYTISNNGIAEKHADKYDQDYLTDLLKNKSVDMINTRSKGDDPFFMMISTPAPHSPWTAAPQYKDQFADQKAPKTPSFNFHGKDKHWLVRSAKNPMTNDSIEYLNEAFRGRWRSLLSVDDLVEQVINTLRDNKMLDNTYIVYASDNGYHMGQFSLPIDKRQLYDFDIRVPLVVRGPGVSRNVSRDDVVLNIDIAPTLVDLATGGKPDAAMDGASFTPLFNVTNKPKWRDDFMVEYRGESKTAQPGCPNLGSGVSQCFPDCVCEDSGNNTYSCVRTLMSGNDFMYCEFTDDETFVEVYDLGKDQHQLTNIKDSVDPQFLVQMNKRLIQLTFCDGDSCRSTKFHPPAS